MLKKNVSDQLSASGISTYLDKPGMELVTYYATECRFFIESELTRTTRPWYWIHNYFARKLVTDTFTLQVIVRCIFVTV